MFRLYPTRVQAQQMNEQLGSCARLYNAMLEQRRLGWRGHGRSVTRLQQERELSAVRSLPEYAGIYSHVVQDVAKRVDLAYQAFFRRVKAGESAKGFPRFRQVRRYDSLTYKQPMNGSVRLVANRVSFSKLAENVKLKQHRPVLGVIKSVTVKRHAGRWFVLFSCDDVPADPTLVAGMGEVGVDVGLVSFATLSTGETIPNPRYGKAALARLASAQRILSRRKNGSNRQRKQVLIVARQHAHVKNQRRDHSFKTARGLVERFSTIVVEDLALPNMVRNHRLARSINDAAWGTFLDCLDSKAEEAGCQVIRVNPRGTSQECSDCGTIVRKSLSQRVHRCTCGLVLDRDVNAAINIKHRAGTRPSRRAAN